MKELSRFGVETLASDFGLGLAEARGVLIDLCGKGIVEPVNKSGGSENFDVFDSRISHHAEQFRLVYVGVVLFGEVILYCIPKYMTDETSMSKKLATVFSALRKYGSEQSDVGVVMGDEGYVSNRLSLIIALLSDYEEHGLYMNQRKVQKTNGDGLIHWPKTICTHLPIVSNGSPVYMNYESVSNSDGDSDFVTELHKSILCECSEVLEASGLVDVLVLDPVPLLGRALSDYGEVDAIVGRLDQELSVQFVTWKQNVINLMKLYFDTINPPMQESGIMCYGTTSFHLVWEKACKKAFGDMLNKTLSEARIELSTKWCDRSEETFLSIIPEPKWRIFSPEGESVACDPVDTLIPDIVTLGNVPGEEGAEFCILDAKYYAPVFEKNIRGVPGVDSVAKQLLYQAAYRDFVLDNGIMRVRNCFLIPCDDEVALKKRAEVDFDPVYYEGEPFASGIEVYEVSAEKVFACYVRNELLDDMGCDFCQNRFHWLKDTGTV